MDSISCRIEIAVRHLATRAQSVRIVQTSETVLRQLASDSPEEAYDRRLFCRVRQSDHNSPAVRDHLAPSDHPVQPYKRIVSQRCSWRACSPVKPLGLDYCNDCS